MLNIKVNLVMFHIVFQVYFHSIQIIIDLIMYHFYQIYNIRNGQKL